MIRHNWIYRLARPFIKPEYLEDIEGDLKELYEQQGIRTNKTKFHLAFSWEVVKLLRPELLSNPLHFKKPRLFMLTHYFKVAFRGLMKNKVTSAVSLFGLSLGLASVILGYLYISYHIGFDDFNLKKDRIFRVVTGDVQSGDGWVKVAAPFLPKLQETVPEIEKFTRFEPISSGDKVLVESGDKKFNESFFVMVDPAFFEIFDFPLLTGDKSNVLSDPSSVVITERIRKKLFGDSDPIGKTILADKEHEFIVTGVIQNPPVQSHLDFDYLISFENLAKIYGEQYLNSWGALNYYGYVFLHEGTSPEATTEKIRNFTVTTDDYTFGFSDFSLQPIKEIHFLHNRGNLLASINPVYLWIFGSISVIVLIIALANYVNLSIALSIKRAREYGVRKALGAARGSLIVQFFAETLIAMLLSVTLAALFIYSLLPTLNAMLGTSILFKLDQPEFWLSLSAIVVVTTLLASSYLAVIVSAFNPVVILKGNVKMRKGLGLQNVLLGIQFLLSLILIINTLIISNQLNFIRAKNIGMNPEGVINVPLYSRIDTIRLNTLKAEMRKIPGVINAAASTFVPGNASWHQTVSWEGQTPEEAEDAYMYIMAIDKDFVRTLGLELVYGDLQTIEESSSSKVRYIVNESALKFLGWEDPGARKISPFGPSNYSTIVGVVKDFNFKSLHSDVEPLLMAMSDRFYHRQLSIRLQTENLTPAMASIESTFKSVMDGLPFEFYFMNDKIESLYKTESETGQLIFYSTFFALLLATMGLFGIISFTIEERTKEIAIRKILGISIPQMVILFSRKYFLALISAILIAWPASWFFMDGWLNNFAYRIPLEVTPFIIGSITTLILIIIVVSVKMLNVRDLDPVDALKYE